MSQPWELPEINGVRCLTMMNGMMERLSNRKWRELLGQYGNRVRGMSVGGSIERKRTEPIALLCYAQEKGLV